MNRKSIIILIIIILLIILTVGGLAIYRNNTSNNNTDNERLSEENKGTDENNSDNSEENVEEENINSDDENNKILVVYYSAQSHTETVAEKIASKLNADIFEILPEEEYTSDDLDWTDSNSRVSREHNDESLRDVELVTTTVENWDEYDTVLIGYPIWWGIAAWPVNTFVQANDFSGKTVIPFCTSSSSGLGQSGDLLEEDAGSGNWLEGHRFSSNPSDSDIQDWIDNLQLSI